jgi:uncharacterized protein (DUF1684 family)
MLEVSVTNRDKTKVAADKITSWIAIEFISNDTLKLAVNFTDPETISIPVSYFFTKNFVATRIHLGEIREWKL